MVELLEMGNMSCLLAFSPARACRHFVSFQQSHQILTSRSYHMPSLFSISSWSTSSITPCCCHICIAVLSNQTTTSSVSSVSSSHFAGRCFDTFGSKCFFSFITRGPICYATYALSRPKNIYLANYAFLLFSYGRGDVKSGLPCCLLKLCSRMS